MAQRENRQNSYNVIVFVLDPKNPHKGGRRDILKSSVSEVWNMTAIQHQAIKWNIRDLVVYTSQTKSGTSFKPEEIQGLGDISFTGLIN